MTSSNRSSDRCICFLSYKKRQSESSDSFESSFKVHKWIERWNDGSMKRRYGTVHCNLVKNPVRINGSNVQSRGIITRLSRKGVREASANSLFNSAVITCERQPTRPRRVDDTKSATTPCSPCFKTAGLGRSWMHANNHEAQGNIMIRHQRVEHTYHG